MTPIKQTIFHNPKYGKFGNCAQAAFASILDLPLEKVPHFADGVGNDFEGGEVFRQRISDWLAEYGLCYVSFTSYPENVEAWQQYFEKNCGHHLIAGISPRHKDTYHLCVGKNGKVVHDPHPDNTGILDATKEHPWEFGFIVKLL